jgi:hypothetical protein
MFREMAEYPNSFGPLGPGEERLETDRFTLCMSVDKRWNTVQRQHFRADAVDEVIGEVRSLLRARGRMSTQWEVGSAAKPPHLVELLLERGLVRDKEPYAVALLLTAAPAPAPPEIIARRVETFEEFTAANAVQAAAFGTPEDEETERHATLAARWRDTPNIMHAARLDGTMVSAGTCAATQHGLLLYGGATLERARGRGAYRALLQARWDESVARGTPALMTQAGSMSRPILERLGFTPVGHVYMLLDEFGAERVR